MFITLEKQYQFFKFLQENDYQSESFNQVQLKRAFDILEEGECDRLFKFVKEGDIKKQMIFDAFAGFVNIQIEIYTKNIEVIKNTNTVLDKNIQNSKDLGKALVAYHNKKIGIPDKKEEDIFSYNTSNIAEITACLAAGIGSCYQNKLGGIEKIMDFKDCNIQIAKHIKAQYDALKESRK